MRAGYPQFFPRCLIISTLIPLPSLGWSKATAAAHLNLTFPFILPVMFTPCFSPSSLLQDAWFQRDHRTNQRPIPAHQWPVSHFRWRLKGTSAPGAPTALRASASPLRESWTATRTKKPVDPRNRLSGELSRWKSPKKPCLHPLLAQGRVWVECVLGLASLWKDMTINGPLSRSYYVFGWEAGARVASTEAGSFPALFWGALGLLVIAYCKVPPETLLFRDCFVRLDSEVVSRASSPGFFLAEYVSGLYASAKKTQQKTYKKTQPRPQKIKSRFGRRIVSMRAVAPISQSICLQLWSF